MRQKRKSGGLEAASAKKQRGDVIFKSQIVKGELQSSPNTEDQLYGGRRSTRKHTIRGADGKFYEERSSAASNLKKQSLETAADTVQGLQEEGPAPRTVKAGQGSNQSAVYEESARQPPIQTTVKKPTSRRKTYSHSENEDPHTKRKDCNQSKPKETCMIAQKKVSAPDSTAYGRPPLSPKQTNQLHGLQECVRTPMTTISEGPDAAIEASPAPPATEACPAEQPVCQSTKPSLNAAAEMRDPSWFDPANGAKVQTVEAALHISNPFSEGALPPLCREVQAQELLRLVSLHSSDHQGGSIYVSGLPGTGKSLTVHNIARQCWHNHKVKECAVEKPQVVSINCMSLKQPSSVFSRALSGFASAMKANNQPIVHAGSDMNSNRIDAEQVFRDFCQMQSVIQAKKGKGYGTGMLILILDELDQLRSQDCSILNSLFSIPQAPRSRLILIGISNSIDMAERQLPKLKEMGCSPHAVPFASYTAEQIGQIIRQRLATLPGPVYQEQCITFCARKMAAATGDMRRALEACSVALLNLASEAASADQQSTKKEKDAENVQICERDAAVPGRRLVGVGDMAKAISFLQGGLGEASSLMQTMRALPQHQQLVLCSACKLIGQLEADNREVDPAPSTPQSTSKVPCSRMASFISPGLGLKAKTPGIASRCSTPKKAANSSARCIRLSVLGNKQECAVGKLHESYAQLCRQINIKPLNSLEFVAACSTLADMGVIVLTSAKEERLRKISLKAHKDDVALALQQNRLLCNLLSLV